MTACAATLDDLLPPLLPLAYRVAHRLTRDAADAEDLVQEAALLACRGFDSFEPGTNFKAWFLRILTNAFLSRCRRDGRAQFLPLDETAPGEEEGPLLRQYPDAAPDPLHAAMSSIETRQILDAMDRLPAEYRAVATLYFVDDLSYEEIAKTLDCPIGTVRSRLHRGRRVLMQELGRLAAGREHLSGAAAA